MSKIAFIYPGQGAQKAGMGSDFYENSETARLLFDQAGEALGLDMKALCFKENEKLDLTEYTQAALVTTCLAMTRVIEERGMKPDITAGLSLGEYSAVAAAGGMEDLDAVRLVRKRGILMQNTVPAGEGGMCAVMGLDAAKIEEVLDSLTDGDGHQDDTAVPVVKMTDIKKGDVTVANYNCPGQIVITGKLAAVEAALGNYYEPLVNGLVDDVDQTIAEFSAALESAGIRDVLEEMENQAAAYVAEKQGN